MDVPWRTFNIHVTFPLHKSFFIVQKSSLYYENALHSKKKKIVLAYRSLKGSDGSSVASLRKSPFGSFIFKSVYYMERKL